MFFRLATTPAGAGVCTGALCGVAMGAYTGLRNGSIVVGLVVGVAGGLFLGIATGVLARQRLAPLAGLPPADRMTVARTVHKGLATSDLRLAIAVVDYASNLRRVGAESEHLANRRIFPLLAAAQVALAVAAAIDRDWARTALQLLVAVAILLTPGYSARRRARWERAERSAQALLGRG